MSILVSTLLNKNHYRQFLLLVLLACLYPCLGCKSLSRYEYTPETQCGGDKNKYADAKKLQYSAITINTWRLEEEHRVDRLMNMLHILGGRLHSQKQGRYPDVIFFQELEGVYHKHKRFSIAKKPTCRNPQTRCKEPAISLGPQPQATKAEPILGTFKAIRNVLKETHWFGFCVCAHDKGKKRKTIYGKRKSIAYARSAVGMAIRLSTFGVSATNIRARCCPIPVQWTTCNHERCTMLVELSLPSGRQLLFSSIHLSTPTTPRKKEVQCLRKIMTDHWKQKGKKRSVMFGGDFNFSPRSTLYQTLTKTNPKQANGKSIDAPFEDAYCAKRGRTSPTLSRIDMLFKSKDIIRIKSLNQRKTLDTVLAPTNGCVRPLSELPLYSHFPWRCQSSKHKYSPCYPCPISDHMPEGALFQMTNEAKAKTLSRKAKQ